MNYFSKRGMSLLLISTLSSGFYTKGMQKKGFLSLPDSTPGLQEYTPEFTLKHALDSKGDIFKKIIIGEELSSAAASADGKRVITASRSGTIRITDLETEKELLKITIENAPIFSLTLSPDEKTFLTGLNNNEAILWDVKTGKQLRTFSPDETINPVSNYPIFAVAFSSDGEAVLTGSWDNNARLWDSKTGKELLKVTTNTSVLSVAFTPDGNILTVSGPIIHLWSRTGVKEKELIWFGKPVYSVAVSPDAKFILAGYKGEGVLWNVATQQVHQVFDIDDTLSIPSVAVSPDGKRALTYVSDGTVFLWETANGNLLKKLKGPHEKVLKALFSDDGKSIISVSEDGTIAQWGF